MPTYEYRCQDCGSHVEVVQSFTADPLTTCGSCGGSLRKVFTPIGIVFKGSGFYRTDNRASSKSSTDSKQASAETKADSSESSTSTSSSSSDKAKKKSSDTASKSSSSAEAKSA